MWNQQKKSVAAKEQSKMFLGECNAGVRHVTNTTTAFKNNAKKQSMNMKKEAVREAIT